MNGAQRHSRRANVARRVERSDSKRSSNYSTRKPKKKQSHFWVIRHPPQANGEGGGVLFHFDPGRNHEVALELLGDFRGALQCDGYVVYPVIDRKTGRVTLCFCWAHVRRKFVEALEFGGPVTAW